MKIPEFSDEAFWAYLAGFIDGEGYVESRYLGVKIVLANCVRLPLDEIRDRLGFGTIRSQRQKEHWRRKYTLNFQNGHECRTVLEGVLPYLRIKQGGATKVLAKITAWEANVRARDERNIEIRRRSEAGEMHKDIAASLGVSAQTVSRVIHGQKWPSEYQPRGGTFQGAIKP